MLQNNFRDSRVLWEEVQGKSNQVCLEWKSAHEIMVGVSLLGNSFTGFKKILSLGQ